MQSRTLYTACGRRTARAYGDRLEFFTIDLADPGFSPTIPCPFANYELAYSSSRIPRVGSGLRRRTRVHPVTYGNSLRVGAEGTEALERGEHPVTYGKSWRVGGEGTEALEGGEVGSHGLDREETLEEFASRSQTAVFRDVVYSASSVGEAAVLYYEMGGAGNVPWGTSLLENVAVVGVWQREWSPRTNDPYG